MAAHSTVGSVQPESGRNLPLFHETPIARRMFMLLPALAALQASWQGHALFEATKRLHPELYSGAAHVGFFVVVLPPAILVWRQPGGPQARLYAAVVLVLCYLAVSGLASQALRIVSAP